VIIRTVINGLTFDCSTKNAMLQAVRDALIAFMTATAKGQAEATREAQRAGIAHATPSGANPTGGRNPSFNRTQFTAVRACLDRPKGESEIGHTTGLTRQTVVPTKRIAGRKPSRLPTGSGLNRLNLDSE
jgi:putative DNA-invertase from lambdoid prophage Rac